MTSNDAISHFRSLGFVDTVTNYSGLCTTVLYDGELVVRIGFDERYDYFAKHVLSQSITLTNVARLYSHLLPLGPIPSNGHAYSVTFLELLDELTSTERKDYETWVNLTVNCLMSNSVPMPEDKFGLLADTKELYYHAKKNKFGMDFMKGKNIMKRGDTFVHIDPFS